MNGWYELSKSGEQYRFILKAGNGETILTSERYTTKASAENGITSVQTNSPQIERFALETSKDNKCYFNIKAANHQIIGTSQMYISDSSRSIGIKSVMNNGPTKEIKDLT